MGLVKKIIGPKLKYDKTKPYDYIAKIPVVEGEDDLATYYFAYTICGLVEVMENNQVARWSSKESKFML